MTRDEAKLILQSCRPGGRDAGDPQFAEALALAKTDSELAAWFAGQQRFDANVSAGLQQVRVPARLKAEILALGKSEPSPEPSPILAWWRHLFSWSSPVAWAMATAVVVLLSLTIFWKKPGGAANFADFSAQMVNAAVHDKNHVDVHAAGMKQALAWLTAHHGEKDVVLPVALNQGQGLTGCRVLDWHGQKVSMLCYMVNGSKHVDVFVADAALFPDAPPLDQPQFARSNGKATVYWTHADKVYLAVSHGDDAVLKQLMSPAATADGMMVKFVWNKSPVAVSNL
ncbi:MAG TPA: hypothetical protein VGO57_04665 [Verrucomicrobiae bacterium]|jgi:hypothetical protein